MNAIDSFGIFLISLLSAFGVYYGYKLCKSGYKLLLMLYIQTRLINRGRYNEYVMLRGNLQCDTPITTFFDTDGIYVGKRIICSNLKVDIGNKQIGNKTKLFFDVVPTKDYFSLATRPVNEMNFYIEWNNMSTVNKLGSNIMLDNKIINIRSAKVFTDNVESRSYIVPYDLLYKHSKNLNQVGYMLTNVIKDYKLPYDTKYIRFTESIVASDINDAYVFVIGKYDENSVLQASHVLTSLKGDTLHQIIKEDIIE